MDKIRCRKCGMNFDISKPSSVANGSYLGNGEITTCAVPSCKIVFWHYCIDLNKHGDGATKRLAQVGMYPADAAAYSADIESGLT